MGQKQKRMNLYPQHPTQGESQVQEQTQHEKKPINRNKKGNRRQRHYANLLISQGWKAEVARRPFKGFGSVDFFGLWDIIAYKEGWWLLVQVKSNVCPSKVKAELKAFVTDGHFVKKRLVIYKDYSRFGPWVENL